MEDEYAHLDPLIRDVLAEFGDAYFYSESLHRELCYDYTLLSFDDPSQVTGPRLIEVLESSFNTTLGQIIKLLEKHIPSDLYILLVDALKTRNFLAHRFWFERVQLMYSEEGLYSLIAELSKYRMQFHIADQKVMEFFQPLQETFGINQELIEDSMKDIIAGQPPDPPFPQRKLKKLETIIQVWLVDTSSGEALIFETEDGLLWQLCDVGLGWSNYNKIGSDWKIHHNLKKYLPATIKPRPKCNNPWEYKFPLNSDILLWVKPGNKKRTYIWGLEKSNPS